MKIWRLVKRSWFYFRIGNATYLTFPLSFIQFVLIIYSLGLARIPFLAGVHLWLFSIVFIAGYALAGIWVGHLHMNTQAFTEAEVTSIKTPYMYRMIPVGREAKLNTPMSLLDLRIKRAMLETLGIMSPELDMELRKYERMILTLLEGGEVR